MVQALGSPAHQALIEHVAAHYAGDERVRAVAVFGSVGAGTWHELSDVDLDVVTQDGARVDPGAEIAALFGPRAVIVLTGTDAADADLAAAGAANRGTPGEPGRLDAIVRDAIYAQKSLARGQRWAAVAAVARIRWSLTDLRGRRDGLRLDPADPAQALATVLAEVQADYDLSPRRRALLAGKHRAG